MPLTKYLENKCKIATSQLRILLIKHGLKKNICEICGINDWMGRSLSLHLHHVDGNNHNNSFCNLQLLCPNCHSQTHNYAGKKKRLNKTTVCEDEIIQSIKTSYNRRQALIKVNLAGYGGSYKRIDEIISKHQLSFLKKEVSEDRKQYLQKRLKTIEEKYNGYDNMFKKKIDWPSKETLQELLMKNSCAEVSRLLGVSGSGVRKQAKRYEIDIKMINPWSHKHGRK